MPTSEPSKKLVKAAQDVITRLYAASPGGVRALLSSFVILENDWFSSSPRHYSFFYRMGERGEKIMSAADLLSAFLGTGAFLQFKYLEPTSKHCMEATWGRAKKQASESRALTDNGLKQFWKDLGSMSPRARSAFKRLAVFCDAGGEEYVWRFHAILQAIKDEAESL